MMQKLRFYFSSVLLSIILVACLWQGNPLYAQVEIAEFRTPETIEQYIPERGMARMVADRVIVRLAPGLTNTDAAGIRNEMSAEHEFNLDFVDAQVWRIEHGRVAETVQAWENHPSIELIQPDYIYDIPDFTPEPITQTEQPQDGLFPNDEFFNLMWGLHNTGQEPFDGTPGADISAPQAWEVETGDPDVIIAVLDTGVDYNHPDLQDNMWQDADGNFGANFAGGPVNDPMDLSGHGTHVAGTVAAVGNNSIGVTGVMWNASIMAVRVCHEDGCPLSAISEGLGFAIENGARISNNSYGTQVPTSSGPSPIYVTMMENAIAEGHLYITSAGNADNDNDVLNVYPGNLILDFDNIMTVGNSTPDDTRNSLSNYGLETVQLFAPGTQIASTFF